jgi:hypothetical protein
MDVFNKAVVVDDNIIENLGPLAGLAGVWSGDQGVDTAPSGKGPVETKYRERINFEPIGPVINGPQVLYGLKYATVAWPISEDEPFHEETGYWLWDAEAQLVLRCFIVPRGVMVNAGGKAAPDAHRLQMSAEIGSETFGILSSPFLDKAFRTVRYDLDVEIIDTNNFSYFEDTQLKIHGQQDIFHHTDQNTLVRQ